MTRKATEPTHTDEPALVEPIPVEPSHTDEYVAALLARGRTLPWITDRSRWTHEQLIAVAQAQGLTYDLLADSCNPGAPTADRDATEADNLLVGLDRAARNEDQAYSKVSHERRIGGMRSALRQALKDEAGRLSREAQRESVRQSTANLNARIAERRAARGLTTER